ncbi:MAG TPA: hypothetical protein VL856_16695 [Acidimicrobiia bacterium]|nr:hypothetical protein [Acidimicrobiia bacterium]
MTDVNAIERWLVDEPRSPSDGDFIRGFAERLRACGFDVSRISYALMTMHPEVLWRTVQWRRGQDIVVRDQPHARLDDDFYTRSAVAVVRRTRSPIRVRLVAGELPFPICVDLRAEGATDYHAQPLPFTNGQVSYVSFATDAPDGFSDIS